MGAHMPLPRPMASTKPPSSELLEEVGPFGTRFKVAMDYDFFLRAYRSGKSLKVVDTALSVMRDIGISWQMGWPHTRERLFEVKAVHYKSCNSMLLRIFYFLLWRAYLPYWRVRCLLISIKGRKFVAPQRLVAR